MGEKNFTAVEADKGLTVITLGKNLDYFNCKLLMEESTQLIERAHNIVVNCEKVLEFPKDWLRALMFISINTKKNQKEMKLVNVQPTVLSSMKKEGMERYFIIGEYKESVKRSPDKKKTMDMEFLNPFLTATLHVLKVQAQTPATPGKTFVRKPTDKLVGDVSGIIGIVSDAFTGSVTISFPKETFLKVISRMLGETITTFDKEVADGAGEITNMIFGQAKIELNQKGYGIKTALPSVITGEDHSTKSTTRGPVVVIPFESDVGKFFVEIGLSD